MKLADIRTAVEMICCGPTSIESVSWCLRMGSRKDPVRFERVARGVYILGLRQSTSHAGAPVNAVARFAP